MGERWGSGSGSREGAATLRQGSEGGFCVDHDRKVEAEILTPGSGKGP
jgi:hypothetical protein